jgi:hypothetical protein
MYASHQSFHVLLVARQYTSNIFLFLNAQHIAVIYPVVIRIEQQTADKALGQQVIQPVTFTLVGQYPYPSSSVGLCPLRPLVEQFTSHKNKSEEKNVKNDKKMLKILA